MTEKTAKRRIGKNLDRIRKERGLTYGQLIKKAFGKVEDKRRVQMSRWKGGENMMSAYHLHTLARALDVSADEFFV